ncbi:MAG TPA: hypothetical protein VNQ53_11535 [Nocardioides sp.]|nr:hypothetical protein [Nocardioides sp.]
MADEKVQTWTLTIDGVTHRVEASGSVRHHIRWYADDALVAEKRAAEDRLHLTSEDHGALGVWYGALGGPRRASLAGVDLVPDPGSPAAEFEERVRAHPSRYAAIQTVGGVAKVVVPIVITLLLARLAFSFDWPDLNLPDLPSPNLPDLPSPNLPDIPFPDVTLPDWLRWILENAKYVVPILIAFGLAQAEVKRRRKQDELRAERARQRDEQND